MRARPAIALVLVVVSACSAPAASTPVPVAVKSSEPAPSASPTPAVPSSKFGVLALTRDGFAVRPETDPDPIRVIPQIEHRLPGGIAVSNDGRYVAYWRPIATGGDDLMLYDAATNADPVIISRLADATGGAIAWADDDSGLVFASRPLKPGSSATLSTLSTGDRTVRPIATALDETALLMPLTWIRETKSVSAMERTAEGIVTSYVIAKESGETSRFAVGEGDQVVRAYAVDPQSRMLAYLVTFTCQDKRPGCSIIRYWTLEDPQQATWDGQLGPERAFDRVLWRPFSRSPIVAITGSDPAIQTLCVTRCGTRGVLTSKADQLLVRPDGSAVLGASFSGRWPGTMYPLATGGSDIDLDLTTNGGGAPAFSVTLDVATATRIASSAKTPPLLTQDEILGLKKLVPGATVNKVQATLSTGTFPFAGTVPVWHVVASGQFTINTRGPGAPFVVPCMIWSFNARLGTLIDERWITDAGACPV